MTFRTTSPRTVCRTHLDHRREPDRPGPPGRPLQQLQQEIRTRAADPKLRVFLFQLLCIRGSGLARSASCRCVAARTRTLAMVNTYRGPCSANGSGGRCFKAALHVLGAARNLGGLLVRRSRVEARQPGCCRLQLRHRPLTGHRRAPAALDGRPSSGSPCRFMHLGDARSRDQRALLLDSVLAGLAKVVFEAPVDLRDLVWLPAQVQLVGGGGGGLGAVTPTLNRPPHDVALLSRKTEWLGLAGANTADSDSARWSPPKPKWSPAGCSGTGASPDRRLGEALPPAAAEPRWPPSSSPGAAAALLDRLTDDAPTERVESGRRACCHEQGLLRQAVLP